MTNALNSQEERELHARVEQVRGRLKGLATDLGVVHGEIESLAPQREQHELLAQACGSIEKLGQLGAASLFWGEQIDPARATEQMRAVRSRVSAFQARLGEIEGRRQAILTMISREEEGLEILAEDLYQVREAEERRKLEWIVEREVGPVPGRVQTMAWARGGEDDKRFRKTLAASLSASVLFGALLPMIHLPLPKPFQPDAMPKHLVQLVRQELTKPIPRQPVMAEKPPEQKPPETTSPVEPKPSGEPGSLSRAGEPSPEPGGPLSPDTPGFPAEAPSQRAGKAGILAFKDQFVSLAKDRVAQRLGADARFRDSDDVSQANTRSMLTTNAPGSSGGINLASLSRNLGGGLGPGGGGGGGLYGDGGGGGGLGGGGRGPGGGGGGVTSPISSIGGGERPKAHGGPGASRTDEEIQIVFDRHKASFYRLYNRELRNNPTLQGQIVVRLTIEPDGSVSMCVLHSSDMDAQDLARQVVNRVRAINFGAKEGVQAVTIVYPIDFLPAA